jgi:hypothetical protein
VAKSTGGGHARSAKTGQYVPMSKAKAAPHSVVVEHGPNNSSGTHHRDAFTGEFVSAAEAARRPSTTITEKG